MSAVQNHSCCQGHHHPLTVSERLFVLLEKVSAIALGIFSAYMSFELFLPFFLAGVAVGIYQHIYTKEGESAGQASLTCSQGLLEQLTRVKLPPAVSLAANLAVTWCHIEHHTTVFVPIIAVSLGAWTGQRAAQWSSSFCKQPAHA